MAAYQRMIAETDPIQREEALTTYGTETGQSSVPVPETALTICMTRLRGQLHTILEGQWNVTQILFGEEMRLNRASNAQEGSTSEEEGGTKLSRQNPPVNVFFRPTEQCGHKQLDITLDARPAIAKRVAEALAAACSWLNRWFGENYISIWVINVAEGDRVKFASSTLLDGALTWWNVYVRSVTLDTAHATPWSDFKAMFIRKYCPRNEIKQMENELWNLKVKATTLRLYQRCQELIFMS
ncbi:reverse transcriptase domain-containing protein [Tanacetum coccineum]